MKFIIFIFVTSISLNVLAQKKLPDVSIIYSQASTTLHPKYKLFVQNDDSITLFLKLNLNEFNFVVLEKHKLRANVKIKYMYYNSLESTQIIDSASKVFNITKNAINKSLVSYMKIAKPDSNCFLVIITEDLYNHNKVLSFLNVDITSKSSDRLLLIDADSHFPVFYNYVRPNKKLFIKTDLDIDSLRIEKFIYDTTMPLPPFSSFKRDTYVISDSVYTISIKENFSFEDGYIYKISTLDRKISTSLACFGQTYPFVLYSYQLLKPLQYITTKKEYNDLSKYPNKKLAVDDFWLTVSDNKDVVRNVIKIYYNRIVLANFFFTENKPGWMTDRGMIYTIFGPPNSLYKGDNYEEWVYFNPFSYNQESFYFKRRYNELGIEIFTLKRNSSYLKYWNDAIDSWRKGVFYSF